MDVNRGWAVRLFLPYHREDLYGENFSSREEGLFYPWLVEHFGPIEYSRSAGTWRWTVHRYQKIPELSGYTYGCFVCFRNPEDAMLFKLTWL